MKVLILVVTSLFSLSACAENEEKELFGINIGDAPPKEITDRVSSSGAPFLFIAFPVLDEELLKIIPDFNLFMFPDTKISAGLRADKTLKSIELCESERKKVVTILSKAYPSPYKGKSSKYQLQSKDGRISVKVKCYNSGGFPKLSIEVTNEELENKLMGHL